MTKTHLRWLVAVVAAFGATFCLSASAFASYSPSFSVSTDEQGTTMISYQQSASDDSPGNADVLCSGGCLRQRVPAGGPGSWDGKRNSRRRGGQGHRRGVAPDGYRPGRHHPVLNGGHGMQPRDSGGSGRVLDDQPRQRQPAGLPLQRPRDRPLRQLLHRGRLDLPAGRDEDHPVDDEGERGLQRHADLGPVASRRDPVRERRRNPQHCGKGRGRGTGPHPARGRRDRQAWHGRRDGPCDRARSSRAAWRWSG